MNLSTHTHTHTHTHQVIWREVTPAPIHILYIFFKLNFICVYLYIILFNTCFKFILYCSAILKNKKGIVLKNINANKTFFPLSITTPLQVSEWTQTVYFIILQVFSKRPCRSSVPSGLLSGHTLRLLSILVNMSLFVPLKKS